MPKTLSIIFILFLSQLCSAENWRNRLVKAAMDRTTHEVRYEGAYIRIPYPGGDVPDNMGVCTDVLIRSFRQIGIDLQELVHLDIKSNFEAYPSKRIWNLNRPDTNIDHRRVPNLRTFFKRNGSSFGVSSNAEDFMPGDIVTWKLTGNLPHIGIVVSEKSNDGIRPMIVHNVGQGPEMEDVLFSYTMTGHYRYEG